MSKPSNRKYERIGMVVIGNEVLSGSTRDKNAWFLSQALFDRGCTLTQVVIIPDVHEEIVNSVRTLRETNDAVLTSGGIGPTHDDITMAAIAGAFDVPVVEHPEIIERMQASRAGVSTARRKMACVPEGSELIYCDLTIVPGAVINDVYVFAGVPEIFEAQFGQVQDRFGNRDWHRVEVVIEGRESLFSEALDEIQTENSDVEIGSYPVFSDGDVYARIRVTSRDEAQVEVVAGEVKEMAAALGLNAQ